MNFGSGDLSCIEGVFEVHFTTQEHDKESLDRLIALVLGEMTLGQLDYNLFTGDGETEEFDVMV